MDALRQDDMFSGILVLWPRCRLTKPEFVAGAWLRLRGYSVDVVQSALKRHRAQYLDIIRPAWNTLFRDLASDGGGGSGRNDLQILLGHVRRHAKEDGHKGVDDWTDGDAFREYLDANPVNRAGIVRGWRTYFADRGESPSDFLEE